MAVNEMFPQLPSTGAAQMSDIICAVQGYNAIPGTGLSVQETLSQVYTLFQTNIILSYAGNPNGHVAGTTYQLCWDSADFILYVCNNSGNAASAVWIKAISLAPSNLTWNTITGASTAMVSNNAYIINYTSGLLH